MNRRKFLTIAGASALAAPFLVKQVALKNFSGTPPPPDLARKPLSLAFARDEQKVLGALQARSRNVCLLGGGVMAKVQKRELPYANVLVESDDFTGIKTDLFHLGVEPVSTPELPGSVIRFGYADKPYSVVNLPLNDFLPQNLLGAEHGPIPFAHNFLVYSVGGKWAVDPYGALGNQKDINLLQTPTAVVTELTCVLAATLDSALLGFRKSAACARLTEACLKQTVTGPDAHLVMEQVINYLPDVLETSGFAAMQKFLLSPLCRSAGEVAGVDLRRVNSALMTTRRRGIEIDGARLVGALNREFLRKTRLDGMGFGLSDYMATQGFMVRRTDLLTASLKLNDAQLALA